VGNRAGLEGNFRGCGSRQLDWTSAVTFRGATVRIYEETGHCPNWERPVQLAADLREP
jgi:pimeloyl-ACP methyl ester carboxylesterase